MRFAGLGIPVPTRPVPSAPARGGGAGAGESVLLVPDNRTDPAGYLSLARALAAELGLVVRIAVPEDSGVGTDLPEGVRAEPQPLTDRTVEEPRPAAVIFTGGSHSPALSAAAAARGLPVFLVAAEAGERAGLSRLLPDFGARGRFRHVTRVLAATEADAAAFVRAGLDRSRVEVGGRLEQVVPPLPADEDERDAMADIIKTRPAFLAACSGVGEVPALAEAMSRASRLSHRLLAIVAPARAEDGAELADAYAGHGWRVARRSDGADPTEDVQVYIADGEDELGLWYRLASVTYLGGSLAPPGSVLDPFDAARLGSAVVRGPHAATHQDSADRLSRAWAARVVRSPEDLAEALLELLSPERAALLARRAWEEATRGAELQNRVIDLVRDAVRAPDAA